jgi:polyisoprenoid-binding protein YceI
MTQDAISNTAEFRIRPSNESIFALEIFRGLMRGKKHVLFFEQYDGEVRYVREKPEESSLRFTVEARSGACRDEWLKPADRRKFASEAVNGMLAAEQHPQLSFASTRMLPKSPHRFQVDGNLTIRGLARPVNVDMAITPIGDDRLELDGNASIGLREFALEPPSSALGLARTRNTVVLRFLFWAEKATGGRAARAR